jgi:hypothetical protein
MDFVLAVVRTDVGSGATRISGTGGATAGAWMATRAESRSWAGSVWLTEMASRIERRARMGLGW